MTAPVYSGMKPQKVNLTAPINNEVMQADALLQKKGPAEHHHNCINIVLFHAFHRLVVVRTGSGNSNYGTVEPGFR